MMSLVRRSIQKTSEPIARIASDQAWCLILTGRLASAQLARDVDSLFFRSQEEHDRAVKAAGASWAVRRLGAVGHATTAGNLTTRGDRLDPMSTTSDTTVSLDTGWVSDGHEICWNGSHGAFLAHPKTCPFRLNGRLREYICGPGWYASEYGITLDDLNEADAAAAREFPMGNEPIRWRMVENIVPSLTITEQNNLTVFEMALDHEDSE